MKIELPAKLTDKHHLLFQFYQISCQKPRPGEPLIQEPTFLGCTVSEASKDKVCVCIQFSLKPASLVESSYM